MQHVTPIITIYVRFNVPPLFIVPPPREREHVPRGSVPPSRLQDGGNSRNTEVRTEVRPNATLSKGLFTLERRAGTSHHSLVAAELAAA